MLTMYSYPPPIPSAYHQPAPMTAQTVQAGVRTGHTLRDAIVNRIQGQGIPTHPMMMVHLGFMGLIDMMKARMNSTAEPQPQGVSPTQVIGFSEQAYVDGEFYTYPDGTVMMTYQDQHNQIHLVQMDPVTGNFMGNPSGTVIGTGGDFLVDVESGNSLSEYPMLNGAEFSKDGSQIIWGGPDANGVTQLMVYDMATQTTAQATEFPQGIAAPFANDDMSKVLVATWDDPNNIPFEATFQWFDLDDPTELHPIPLAPPPPSSGPLPSTNWGANGIRWAPEELYGNDAIVTTTVDANGTVQAALYDTTNETLTPLTTNPGNKSDISFVQAPDFGNQYLMYAVVNNGTESSLLVYQQTPSGEWVPFTVLDTPGNTQLSSPEAVVIDGQTYFIATANGDRQQGGVYLLSADGETSIQAMKPAPQLIPSLVDPEVVVGQDGIVHIYAYDVKTALSRPGNLYHASLTL